MSVITEFTGVDDIEDTDLLLVQNSQTVGFKMTGLKYKKLHDIIIASSLTVTGPKIHAGSSVRIYFNTDIAGANTSTAMVINYNSTNITVKAPKDGSLIDYTAKAVGNSYLYCQAYTTLELLYDGTNFVIIGNPVVISNADYTIYTDGTIAYTTTGITNILQPKIWNEVKDLGRFGNSNYHLYEVHIAFSADLTSSSENVGKLSDHIQLKSDARVVEWNPCFETQSGNTFGNIINDSLLACYVVNSNMIYARQNFTSSTVSGTLKISFKYISVP